MKIRVGQSEWWREELSSKGLREETNREKALQAEERPEKTEVDVNFITKD